ncbi:extracellular solute-binding protein [uncultured Roseobacter sp.]|uniref:extracellular solute-binding protein n=1 Tax=uncultured Roseobacter sp. TaxID=114847 RepID=UPI0026302FAA|nr:extracellular solute-binding protein [uncultured Roseobacter sp.]
MPYRLPVAAPRMCRRTLMRSALALGATSMVPQLARATASKPLYVDVAEWVRGLVGGVPGQLEVLFPNGSEQNLAPIASAFTEMTKVKVKLRGVPAEKLNTQIALEVMAEERRFDVALPATYGLPDLVASDVIQPLNDFAEIYEPADFRRGILYDIGDRFDDKLYGFQADGDVYLMFYLKELIENPNERAAFQDAYGMELAVPKTWAELDQQMAWFHRPDQDLWGGLLLRSQGYLAWEWWSRFHGYGMWPFSEQMEPQIDAPAGIAALEDMIRSSAYLHPDAKKVRFTANWELFSQGKTYCNIGWGGAQKFYNAQGSALRGKLCYGPTPGGEIGAGGKPVPIPFFNWGWSYVVSRASSRPEVAYLFSLFASTPEMSTRAVREAGGFFDPIRPEHYEDPVIRDVYSDAFLKVHKSSLRGAMPDLFLMNQPEYFRVLEEALADALRGETTPSEALVRTSQLWEMITSRAGRSEQIRRWQELRAKYPTEVARHLRDVQPS